MKGFTGTLEHVRDALSDALVAIDRVHQLTGDEELAKARGYIATLYLDTCAAMMRPFDQEAGEERR